MALIGTFAPRKCGIATFSADIVEQLARFQSHVEVDVYALDNPDQPIRYEGVAGVIDERDRESFFETARIINESGVDAVWLQHEYGIFGGDDGQFVCDLVDRLAAPLILTPHTVLGEPSERQEAILSHLVNRASSIMVMSFHARDLLATRYGAPHEILTVIEHGAPDRPFGRQAEFKERLGLTGRDVLTTFGLLGPGKGLEYVIEALPAIVERHPAVLYRIVGATHPNLVAEQGETYREGLKARAAELGVADHIEWVDRFVDTEELLDQLEACDIYLTPYPNLQQSTSGTLSYAVALGKAVLATPYLHARELLRDGAGCLIEPESAQSIAREVNRLLDDRDALDALQRRAYAKGRETIWPRFAEGAAQLVEGAVAPAPRRAPVTATPGLTGVFAMSDATGMFQHAIGIVPDRRHGYCLDDNARALMLMNVAEGLKPTERARWTMRYASFVQHAWNEDARVFRNFMNFDRTWCEEEGSEDSNGRGLWALGATLENAPDADIRSWAQMWFDRTLPSLEEAGSPRAMAFTMLGCAARLRVDPDHGASRAVLERGGTFLAHLLDASRRPDWAWFEAVLGYDNPRLSQALIEAGMALGRPDFTAAGLETLDWIARQQTSAEGHFRPIGSDSFGHPRTHLPFDQQPLEAQAAIEAARAAFAATGEPRWIDHARIAWNWFHGANDRGVVLADLASGRCRDGINPRGANANCGAESILAFQLSHYSMIALEMASRGESGNADVGARNERTENTLAAS
ncbi:glycosyltransferase family 4 protein [Aurantiacibacter spongiae]|uniref:Glycosyltransferase n=1 Tax=Aurantiacibacter spongiae TaxID=2488860 RepID=A0A3N5CU68_9SPHN|nr:glycosyltransferase family 4 protein [Aurantiacibacter spongiae]RPF72784.1 glycosyltransferase [Aurantiacibacter spongiae]